MLRVGPQVELIADRRSLLPAVAAADHPDMREIMRITDSDEGSLAARVEAALAGLGGQLAVSRFTLWYTTRPPVHHAVLRAEAEPKP